MGLAITHKFVQLMGGDISVSTRLGKGSIFKFDIQASLEQATEIQPTQPKRRVIGLAPDQRELRILVVEDHLENRLLMVQRLTAIGFAVREAENGQDAVKLWSRWQPHLIWMDIRMPVMDGYEATRQIKAREQENLSIQNPFGRLPCPEVNSVSPQSKSQIQKRKTVIIALTANAFEDDRQLAVSAGCDDFVRKPVREEDVFEKMAHYLGVRYVYEEPAPFNDECSSIAGELRATSEIYHLSASIPSIEKALAQMPAEWVAKLHTAALCAREKEIWKLIAQIPSENAALAEALAKKVNDFRLDQIIDLTSNG